MTKRLIPKKVLLGIGFALACASTIYLIAADHIDAPAVTGTGVRRMQTTLYLS
jgi:hypothetical protein